MPTVLLADDSIAVRKVAERLLTEAGLGVTLAANGEEALAYLAKARPDVVVSDVIMPDKSGYEVCAYVRGNSMLASTPVLLISGIVNDEVTKQAESCRADGVLKKPFQGTALKDRVLELLANRQGQAAALAPKPVPAQAASPTGAVDRGPRLVDEHQATYAQTAIKLKEAEDQLRSERARTEGLTKRVAELEVQTGRAKEIEALLQTARQRIAELEAALHAERAAAAQLVQQLTDVEQRVTRAKDVETRLVREEQRVSELHQKARDAETALAAERAKVRELNSKISALQHAAQQATAFEGMLTAEQQKGTEIAWRLQELEKAAMKVQQIEGLLATERDRNRLLTHRVSETEQAAENATKRFEDMVRKLGEIAGLASQLGIGKGRS